MVSRTAVLRAIQRPPFIEMHPEDAAAIGASDGQDVVVSGAGHSATVKLVVADIARGAVFMPYAQRGLEANRLMSGPDPRVEVSLP